MSNLIKNRAMAMQMTCTFFFLLFTFIYLYDYQADIMAVTQSALSKGATRYNRTIGAVLITLLLWLLQIGVCALTKLRRQTHAVTYFPSFVLLALLSDLSPEVDTSGYVGRWLWLFPLLMLVFAGVVWFSRQLESLDIAIGSSNLLSKIVWTNLLMMILMAMGVTAIGCSDEVFHYRMNMENRIAQGDFEGALKIGSQSEETDSSLTMMRAWALSGQNELGERLFEYALTGGSDALLPNGVSVRLLMAPEEKLYKRLGVVFVEKMRPKTYFEKLHQTRWATKASHDWLLCAYLLDRDLEHFVRALGKYYHVDSTLPKHYREALILYNHLTSNPYIVYDDNVMDADYEDFQTLDNKYKDPRVKYTMLRDSYGKTYWFYYYFKR
ncbi:MAG: hypothetical protein KAZ98_02770 [Prevotella sp.]|nr:hypothetical protein [Prevotella sp.]